MAQGNFQVRTDRAAFLRRDVDEGCGEPQTDRKGDWIQTFTGRQYWPLDPRPDDVHIADVAHHLAMLCRFTGACSRFYSVAEHAWHASFVVPGRLAFATLHHDDAEYVCNDLARPVKRSITGYDSIERMNFEAIAVALNLPNLSLPAADQAEIKYADNVMLLAEQQVLMRPAPAKWAQIDVDPSAVARAAHRLRTVREMTWHEAEIAYLARHYETAPESDPHVG